MFETLPTEINFIILQKLPINEIILCQEIFTHLKEIMKDDYFWQLMLIRDYNCSQLEIDTLKKNTGTTTMEQLYYKVMNYHKLPLLQRITTNKINDFIYQIPYYIVWKYLNFPYQENLTIPTIIRVKDNVLTKRNIRDVRDILEYIGIVTIAIDIKIDKYERQEVILDFNYKILNYKEREGTLLSFLMNDIKRSFVSSLNTEKDEYIRDMSAKYEIFYN